jgi:hypothetical protein
MTKNVEEVSVDAKKFSSFLNKVFLGGLLNECVLHSDKGIVSASSIDPSNIIFLSVQEDIDISSLGELGIGDIGIISKFISECPSEKLKLVKNANRLNITHSGIKIEYLLTDTSLITTSVEGGKIDEIIGKCEYSFTLTKEARDAFLSAVNTLKVKTVSAVVNKSQVILTGGLVHEHNFNLVDPISVVGGSHEDSFTCSFYADYLKAVFSVLDFKEGEEPTIVFSPDYPMVVQEANNSWAVFPLTLD